MQVADKVFVVTGGGNGIGREVVLELLARGARVAAVDLRATSLEETARLAAAEPDQLSTHTVDVTDPGAVAALGPEVRSLHGQVDGLVNVAGIIQRFAPFLDLETAEIEKVLAVNFWGVVHLTREFLPHLVERTEASLVNVASMGAFVPVPGQAVYGASKAAVKLLTEALYAELRGTAVTVTAVYPGAIGTDIAANSGVGAPDGEGPEIKTTSPRDAGRQVVDGIEEGAYRVRIGRDATMLDRLSRLMPRRATDLVARRMQSLLDG
ncbi:MAG: SDR family oxidoreductase [Nocardioides sp.]|nr:SDR family oxidoreductase [Nocardioides sp.]